MYPRCPWKVGGWIIGEGWRLDEDDFMTHDPIGQINDIQWSRCSVRPPSQSSVLQRRLWSLQFGAAGLTAWGQWISARMLEVQQRSCQSVRLEIIWIRLNQYYIVIRSIPKCSVVLYVFQFKYSTGTSAVQVASRLDCSPPTYDCNEGTQPNVEWKKAGQRCQESIIAPKLPVFRLESWSFHFHGDLHCLQLAPSWHRRPQSPPYKRGLSSDCHPPRNWWWFHSYIKAMWWNCTGIVHIVLHKVLKTDMWIRYIQCVCM